MHTGGILLLTLIFLSACLEPPNNKEKYKGRVFLPEDKFLFKEELVIEPEEIKGICLNVPGEVGYMFNATGRVRFAKIGNDPFGKFYRFSGKRDRGGGRQRGALSLTLWYLFDNRGSGERVKMNLSIFSPQTEEYLPPVTEVLNLVEERVTLEPGENRTVCFDTSLSGKDYLELSLIPLKGGYPYWIMCSFFREGRCAVEGIIVKELGNLSIPENAVLIYGVTKLNTTERCLQFVSRNNVTSEIYVKVTRHIREGSR
jgi:hypothetical protein